MPLLFVLLVVIIAGFAYSGWSGAPWVPARRRDLDRLLDDAQLDSGQKYVELGCGDGRLVARAARRGAKAVGYEINPLLWLIAVIRTLRYFPRAQVKLSSLWRANLSQADVVMTFLVPRTMPKLGRKFFRDAPEGARLVSYIFALPGHKPHQRGAHWFIYIQPTKKAAR